MFPENDTFKIDQHSAERIMIGGRKRVSKEKLMLLSPDAKLDVLYDATGDAIISVTSFVHAMPFRKIDVYKRWPATWWDAIKDRWFPGWAKHRWPVKWEIVDINEHIYGPVCPHMQHPDMWPLHLKWMMSHLKK